MKEYYVNLSMSIELEDDANIYDYLGKTLYQDDSVISYEIEHVEEQ